MSKKVSNSKERLKEMMSALNLKQADIVKRTGIPKSALSCYISGRRDPRQDQISRIVDPYGINPAWLMGYDVPMYNSSVDIEKKPNHEQVTIMYLLSLLNKEGSEEAFKRIEELTQLDKYKKE